MSREHTFAAPIPVVSVAALQRRLELLRSAHPGPHALAFDADGTLWSGDVGFDLFDAAVGARVLRPAARDALVREAHAAGLSATHDEDANAIALRLLAAWAAGDFADDRAFRMMAWAFAGHTEGDVLAFAEQVQRSTSLAARVHAPAREIVQWAHREGIDVWVVSASPRAAVVAGAALLGIAASRVIGVTPVTEGGVLTTELHEPISFDAGKPLAWRAEAPTATLLAAFGDTASDAPLLRAAHLGVAVGPNARLRLAAPSIPGLVELSLEGAPASPGAGEVV